MSIEDTEVQGEKQKHCSYVFPEGHEKHGTQCRGVPSQTTGLCVGHARAAGLTKHGQVKPQAASNVEPEVQSLAERAAAVSETASQSLDADLAAWLNDDKTRRRLRKRWDAILDNGADTELIRLLKDVMDRVYGRASEHREAVVVEIPDTVAGLRALTREERRAAIMQLERGVTQLAHCLPAPG